jgi:Ca2+-binding EF-hand superfamily protein
MKMTTKAMMAGLVLAMSAGAAMADGGPRRGKERPPMTREAAIEKAAERFDAADKNGDGVLSREEAKEMRGDKGDRKGGKFGKDGDRREAMLERFDVDGDGKLSEEERAAMREALKDKKPKRF